MFSLYCVISITYGQNNTQPNINKHLKFKEILTLPATNLIFEQSKFVVTVVQLVERQIVILVVAGSSPVGHPIFQLLTSDHMSVSIEEFKKAVNSLKIALDAEINDLNRDATIQRFEFCVELAWKTSKKFMGTNTSSPKQVIREMAQANLIDDVSFWLESIDQRNLSSHTYNEELAEKVYLFAKSFYLKASLLITKLEA